MTDHDERTRLAKKAANELFKKCVKIKTYEDGTLRIDCKLHLWGISSKDHDSVNEESRRYWYQYYMDGEYDELLKGAE